MHPYVREKAEAYYAHHFGCGVCKRAGAGRVGGQRCKEGLPLWEAYKETSKKVGSKRAPGRSYYHPAEFAHLKNKVNQ